MYRAECYREQEDITKRIKQTLFREDAFQNTVLNHSHQLSIWKFDAFGCVKIREKYFTPNLRGEGESYNDFVMQLSIDKETILLYEEPYGRHEIATMVFDINTLEKLAELKVQVVDPDIPEEMDLEISGHNEIYNNSPHQPYATQYDLPIVQSWG